MGANQQTSVPAFTAGQVLTAQQQTEINTGIPVFADSTARTAAFGGTGEKVLAEGQYSYLEDTNSTEVYDGSSWVSVGTAPGLVLVSATTIGSAVTSVNVTNAFSATYDAYRIIVTGGAGSTSASLRLQLGASTASYYDVVLYINSAALTTPLSGGTSNGSLFSFAGSTDTDGHRMALDVLNPFLAKQTSIHGLRIASTAAYGVYAGFHNVSTSYSDFTISISTGTMTGGTIRVYGYKN